MISALRRLLRLRKDEQRASLQAFLVLFHIIAGHTMLETARDALFLAKMPPSRLTTMYVALAGITLVTSTQLSKFSRSFGARNGLIATLVGGAWIATLFYFQPQSALRVTALYLFTGVLAGIFVAQFWLVIGRMFTVTQGRRVFGPIAAGGVLGAAVGSALSAVLLVVFRIDALLIFAAGAFLVATLLVTVLPEDAGEPLPIASMNRTKSTEPAMTETQRVYVRRLAMLVVLAFATSLVADYVFKATAAATIPKEELGGYFARSYAVINALALVVQLFFSSRLLARAGVIGAVMIAPASMLVAASVGIAAGVTARTALALKGLDGSLKHSVQRVAAELMYLPLPAAVRDRAHVLIDTVLSRIAQAGAAAIVLGLVATGNGSTRVLTFLALGLAIAWFILAGLVRKPYLDLFRDAIASGRFEAGHADAELDLASVERVIEALSSRDATHAIAALHLLEQKNRARLVPALILYHESEEVLRAALPILSKSGGSLAWVPLAERLLAHPNESVRLEALRALARVDRDDVLERASTDTNPVFRAHAIHAIVQKSGGAPANNPRLAPMLEDVSPEGREARRGLLTAIAEAEDSSQWGDVVLAMIAGRTGRELPHEIVAAISRIGDPRFIPVLIERLGVRDGRGGVRDALVRMGDPALAALEGALWAAETDRHTRLHIPRTISRFQGGAAVAVLLRVLEESKDGHVRYKALRGLGRMVTEGRGRVDRRPVLKLLHKNLIEHFRLLGIGFSLRARLARTPRLEGEAALSLRLLLELVDAKANQALERAFRLLQIAHPRERIDRAWAALSSADKRVRASAVEFLDALTLRRGEEEIRDLLRRALDDPSQSALAQSTIEGIVIPAGYENAVGQLLEDTDETVALLAAHHASLVEGGLRDAAARTLKIRPTLERAIARFFPLTPEVQGAE